MEELKKYVCLLPTDGHQKGDVVEMTEEQFAGINANEPEPRFEVFVEDVEDAPAEEVATDAAPEGEEVVTPEATEPEAPATDPAAPASDESGGATISTEPEAEAPAADATPEGDAPAAEATA
jgi:hypothetical protein